MSEDNNRADFDPTTEVDYACFVDVLGYGPMLLQPAVPPMTERERLDVFLQIWENLYGAIIAVREELDRPKDANEELGVNCFSDSFYISCGNPQRAVFAAALLYYKVYLYYQHQTQNDKWLPWLRGAGGSGWLVDMRDPALNDKAKDPQFEFRNPVGPALARAYLLAEKSGMKGFRLFVDEHLRNQVHTPKWEVSSDADLERIKNLLCDRAWPKAGTVAGKDVFDVPWWRLNDSGMNIADILERHKWQASRFGDPAQGMAQFDATFPLINGNA